MIILLLPFIKFIKDDKIHKKRQNAEMRYVFTIGGSNFSINIL